MKRAAATSCLLGLAALASADTLVLKGELTFTSTGIGKISECGSGRVLTLGVMASNPYFRLTQRYKEISGGGKVPVLIEVSGTLMKTSGAEAEATIQNPSVVALVPGTCSNAAPNNALERTREG